VENGFAALCQRRSDEMLTILADKIVGLLTELDELEHGAPKATRFRAKADHWDRSLAATSWAATAPTA